MALAKRRSGKPGWRFAVLAAVVFVLVLALVRNTLLDVYYIPSASMEPLLTTGDRVLVSRTDFGPAEGSPAGSAARGIRRGDVVVFDGRGSFVADPGRGTAAGALAAAGRWLGAIPDNAVYVKRVLGVAGDTVKCCSASGLLEINGVPVPETYLHPGDAPSDMSFEVRVPRGKLWLMGDHRSVSADSRSLLGAPGGGLVSTDRVIGRPVDVLWPLGRLRSLPRDIGPGR